MVYTVPFLWQLCDSWVISYFLETEGFYMSDTVPRYVRGGHYGPEPANRYPHRLRAGQEPEASGIYAVLGR